MARIKIKNRKEPIELENERAKKIKVARFGDVNGNGKVDPFSDIDLGDEWAGSIGQVEWIELDRKINPSQTKAVSNKITRLVKIVPFDYQLLEDEEFC